MKTLGVVALAIAIAGAAATWAPYVVDPACTFDPQDACNKCPWDISWLQFVADGCDCNKYYMCEKDEFGNIQTHLFQCDPCMCFSNDVWTCSIKIADGPDCPTNPPPTIVPIPTQDAYTNCFCVDFDDDAREHEYYQVDDTCGQVPVSPYVIDSYWAEGLALESHGNSCHVEIPYFQNNQFKTFALCGMFRYFSPYSGTKMGLAYDGWNDDCAPGSIQIFKDTDDHVVGGIRTAAGQWFFVKSRYPASPLSWHKTCLIYNGFSNTRTLSLTLDYDTKTISQRGLVGLTALSHCNLRLGEILDDNRDAFPFYGQLDTWCFSTTLLRTTQCSSYGIQPNIQVE